MALAAQIQRLAKHSAIYGVGGFVQRALGLILFPIYLHYLSKGEFGRIEMLIALSLIIFTLLRAAIQNSFFRFYFDADDEASRARIVRTAFWSTMVAATAALAAALALAARGESTIDAGEIEQEITPKGEEQTGTRDVAIACPDDVEAEEGGEFDCDLTAPGGIEAKVEVTQTDDDGNVRWRVVRP